VNVVERACGLDIPRAGVSGRSGTTHLSGYRSQSAQAGRTIGMRDAEATGGFGGKSARVIHSEAVLEAESVSEKASEETKIQKRAVAAVRMVVGLQSRLRVPRNRPPFPVWPPVNFQSRTQAASAIGVHRR